MRDRNHHHHHLIRDIMIIIASVVFAVYLSNSPVFEEFLLKINGLVIFGTFFVGFFMASVFTTAPAVIALAEISQLQPVWQIAAIAALGAVTADFVIFKFIRDSLVEDVDYIFGNVSNRGLLLKLLHTPALRRAMPFMAMIVIAMPFPDEVGLLMLGAEKTKNKTFILVSYTAHFMGIFAIGALAGLL